MCLFLDSTTINLEFCGSSSKRSEQGLSSLELSLPNRSEMSSVNMYTDLLVAYQGAEATMWEYLGFLETQGVPGRGAFQTCHSSALGAPQCCPRLRQGKGLR